MDAETRIAWENGIYAAILRDAAAARRRQAAAAAARNIIPTDLFSGDDEGWIERAVFARVMENSPDHPALQRSARENLHRRFERIYRIFAQTDPSPRVKQPALL